MTYFKTVAVNIRLIILVLVCIRAEPVYRISAIDDRDLFQSDNLDNIVTDLVKKWAPVVWLAPGERFFPDSVLKFLKNVNVVYETSLYSPLKSFNLEDKAYLTTKDNLDILLQDKNSFLHGTNPQNGSVPIYAVIHRCLGGLNQSTRPNTAFFHVTYWTFYPYNQGKSICVIGARTYIRFHIPIPRVFNKCLGKFEQYGNHVGDWEHVSLYFNNDKYPHLLYISAHNAGAYYEFDRLNYRFQFVKQETRKGFLQKPTYPLYVSVYKTHPILFSANGSHGLWPTPGKHKYTRVSNLLDFTGFGHMWKTWNNVDIVQSTDVNYSWAQFRGKWGNRKSGCHPLSIFGFDICKNFSGPRSKILQVNHFTC